mmetsp:Transcript_18381/g.31419  ORF Transcript_18381/g.31419 Transcript_18381/m.31419 type:complete len:267 (+) Transcript_18381:837-1637(+)
MAPPAQQSNQGGGADPALFVVSEQEFQSYLRILSKFDSGGQGNVSYQDMQKIIVQTKLPQDLCAKIWGLSNPTGVLHFNKGMFMVSMKLLSLAKLGNPIPNQLPPQIFQSIQSLLSQPSQGLQVPQGPSPTQNNLSSRSNGSITTSQQNQGNPSASSTFDIQAESSLPKEPAKPMLSDRNLSQKSGALPDDPFGDLMGGMGQGDSSARQVPSAMVSNLDMGGDNLSNNFSQKLNLGIDSSRRTEPQPQLSHRGHAPLSMNPPQQPQ